MNKKLGKQNDLNIFGYTNYRKYLLDFYTLRKGSERGYSYRSFSKNAGFSSPNILKLVIDGQRNISNEAMVKFAKALGLSGKSFDYFTNLVKMNQSKIDEEKEKYFKTLKKLTPHARQRLLESENLKYLSHWVYPVIREMILLDDFRDDSYWIARRLNSDISHSDVASALNFLKKEKFIEKDENGKWNIKQEMVLSSDEVKSLAIRNYHRQMLECSKETLETLDISQREFGALTFVLPSKSLKDLKDKLKVFRQDLHEWAVQEVEENTGEVVMQVNFQMFPHSKKIKSEKC